MIGIKMNKDKQVLTSDIIEKIYSVVMSRKDSSPEDSYTASLFLQGIRRIAQKVGEEGVETALAAVSQSDEELLNEAADLIYMLIVLLAARDLKPQDVYKILEERFHSKENKTN
tara:strand:+ start:1308 stop:1649 length:342 start_codon:yes stop_codon:yes gene_type:complete